VTESDDTRPTDETPICVVPARGTEPGLPKKNFKQIDGKPLVAHTIEAAQSVGAVDEVYVTTESEALADLAREYGASVPFLRPDSLADANVLLHEVVAHTVEQLADLEIRGYSETTPILVLQPNVPFRRPKDIDAALQRFEREGRAVISVVEKSGFYWRDGGDGRLVPSFETRAVREELEPFYRETGSINVTTSALLDSGTRVGNAPAYVVTDRLSALTIDSVMDLWMAERIADGPHVVFRVDGGGEIGMGHVSRCLTLASELDTALRCELTFVTDEAYPAGAESIREAGYTVHAVSDPKVEGIATLDPDIVFLDVLDTDAAAVRDLHRSVAAVINLEDSAGGLESADFVINALSRDDVDRDSLRENHFTGPAYFVLRDEFRGHDADIPQHAERVLLTFGGSDPAGLSAHACRAVANDTAREYRLVLGPGKDDRETLGELLSACGHVNVRENVSDMGAQMSWADLAVASGGRTVFELAATGTPTLVVTQNEREHERIQRLADRGLVEYLGHHKEVSAAELRAAIERLADDYDRRRQLSERGRDLVDGAGTRRILDLVHDVLLG
jgi:spore coat polysaccharide biosynthesis predicted glycosyltransferase SpsG/CMP-N-acetylneuraminic acid synthetase